MDYSIDNRVYEPSKLEYPIIHITQSWTILQKIVLEGFKPSYCTESLSNNDKEITAAFPMISFTNMSVEDAKNLLKSYGTLAIAMKKSWGAEHKLNPVLYLDRSSELTNHIINAFNFINHSPSWRIEPAVFGRHVDHKGYLIKTLIDLFSYSKNYDGKLIRSDTRIREDYRFGLEREWRYIVRDERYPPFLIGEKIDQKQVYNDMISHIRVDFEIKDIDTIVVETNYEVEEIKKILYTKYGPQIELPPIEINPRRHIYEE
ncbi:abortive infection system antitoxin AbiGi family protein [Spirosoma aerolatum]|uniref:abortive infection system antitoxin AbiGi family protein n=1 Tax=Spirosoma aerolatum TaxID=1211326 RepID=UPI0009AD66C9|nr:abortive infection system antitoxin AbiGi family protein [Spirosoma aerolatum]